MIYPTFQTMQTKLQNDLDIIDEDFVSQVELLGYMNAGIKKCESMVHTLGLDARYFLANKTISLVSGTSDYNLPSDIFATKIVRVFYINGAIRYEIERIRDVAEIPYLTTEQMGTCNWYRYILNNTATNMGNSTGGGPNTMVIRFFPLPQESGAFIQMPYIREVKKLTTSTSDTTNVLEIPEAENYLYAYVKKEVYKKEGNPNLAEAMGELAEEKTLLLETLQEMVPDQNNQILPDMSIYQDMSLDYGWGYGWGY